MTTCLGKNCSFVFSGVFCERLSVVCILLSLLVLMVGCGIWLNYSLIIACLYILKKQVLLLITSDLLDLLYTEGKLCRVLFLTD